MGRHDERLRNSCHGKKWYTTQAKAKKVAQGAHRNFGDPVHEYKCPDCGWWHVGSVMSKEASVTPYKRRKRPVSDYLTADGY